MILLKASLRIVLRRRLETVALVLLVASIVAVYGGLLIVRGNMEIQVYTQTKATLGHVTFFGLFPEDVVDEVGSIPGVKEARLYPIWFASYNASGDRVMMPLVGRSLAEELPVFQLVNGSLPEGTGEALYYTSVTVGPAFDAPDIKMGDNVTVVASTMIGLPRFLEFEIVGRGRGYAFLGGSPYSLVVNDTVILELSGGRYTMLSVKGYSDDSESIDRLAAEVEALLDERGYQVFFKFVNKKETNPIVVLLSAGMSLLTTLANTLIVLAAIIPAAVGAAMAVREARLVAVLKSIGAGPRHLAILYSMPWVMRAVIGGLLGFLAAPRLAEYIIFNYLTPDSEIARIQFEFTPFQPLYDVAFETAAQTVVVVLAGALVPLLLVYRVRIVEALSFVGLRGGARLRLPLPRLTLTIAVRELVSRPWKLAGLTAALLLVAGVSAASAVMVAGINDISDFYASDVPTDLYVIASSISPNPPRPVADVLMESLPAGMEDFVLLDRYDTVNVLGIGDRFRVITVLDGNPEVAFPLADGRMPEAPGEAVVSESLAGYLGKHVGDTIALDFGEAGILEFRIVGLTPAVDSNGFMAIVTVEDYARITGVEPGLLSASVRVDLPDGMDPEAVGAEVVRRVESQLLYDAFYYTRLDIVDSIRGFSNMIEGAMAAVDTVASVLSAIVLAGILLVDFESRKRELAVYYSLGLSRGWILSSTLIQAMIAVALAVLLAGPLAYWLAGLLAYNAAPAIGYIEPFMPGPGFVASSGPLAFMAVALGLSLFVLWARVRRTLFSSVLLE